MTIKSRSSGLLLPALQTDLDVIHRFDQDSMRRRSGLLNDAVGI
jgi:hypothetical protein